MWFTRLSIGNPVMAVMVMLAFVVLGLFSYQRLRIDQFPEIDFPTVVVQTDYPGAAPEVVESEVTKKIEETVNTIAGISQLFSRSYEGSSVVIVQFNLDVNGRRAADDVREKLAIVKASFRTEVKEPRVSRFDPASTPIFSLAVTSPDGSKSVQELTTYADQVLRKRLENVRGVGSITLVGGVKREINVYLKPQAMEAFGVGVDAVVNAVRTENQDLPAGSLRSGEAERTVQIAGRVKRPEDLNQLIIARRGGTATGASAGSSAGSNGQAVRLAQVASVVDGPEELESLALYNGRRMLALEVKKSQGENTIDVVDGLLATIAQLKPQLPTGLTSYRASNSGCTSSAAGNTPIPAAPKVLSNAPSSNSPTILGLTPRRSNHWSIRGLTAAWLVGNNTGTVASDCGKPLAANLNHAGPAYQATASPKRARSARSK